MEKIKIIGLLIVSYFFFLIFIKNNKKVSIISSIIISFSNGIIWNLTKIDALILGELFIVLIDRLLLEKNKKLEILYGALAVITATIYSHTFIPYAICFGYLFIAILIFVILKNKEEFKNNKFKIITFIAVIILSIVGMIISNFIYSNNYTENQTQDFGGINGLFSYIYGCFLPYKNIENKELLSSIYSLSPIPMIIALYYMYKNEKKLDFLMPLTIFTVLGTIFVMSGFGNFIEKITFLQNVSKVRMLEAVNFANLIILLYFFENIDERLFSMKAAIRLTVILIIPIAFIGYPIVLANKLYLTVFTIEQAGFIFLFLNMHDKSYKKVFYFFLLLVTLIGGIPALFI